MNPALNDYDFVRSALQSVRDGGPLRAIASATRDALAKADDARTALVRHARTASRDTNPSAPQVTEAAGALRGDIAAAERHDKAAEISAVPLALGLARRFAGLAGKLAMGQGAEHVRVICDIAERVADVPQGDIPHALSEALNALRASGEEMSRKAVQ